MSDIHQHHAQFWFFVNIRIMLELLILESYQILICKTYHYLKHCNILKHLKVFAMWRVISVEIYCIWFQMFSSWHHCNGLLKSKVHWLGGIPDVVHNVRHQIFIGFFLWFTAYIIVPFSVVPLVSQDVNRTQTFLAIVGVQHKMPQAQVH